jgi:hypothetical protein
MRKYILPGLACLLAACSAVPLGSNHHPEPEFQADGQDYSQPGAYALMATPALPIQAIAVDSTAPGYAKAALADGNLGTHWDNGGYMAATAWASVDLGAGFSLGSIVLKIPPTPAGTSYDVQTSTDNVHWVTALAAQTNTSWNPVTKLLPPGASGRYLRIFWHNNPAAPAAHFSIYELRVQGSGGSGGTGGGTVPVPTPTPTPTPIPTPTATPTPAPLPTVLGPFGVLNASAAVVQFRPGKGRLRIELAGDTQGADTRLEGFGPIACSFGSPWAFTGSVDVRPAGQPGSVVPTGPYTVSMLAVPGEDGVLLGEDPVGNLAELIWPSMIPGELPGPPILRIQLAQWGPDVTSGAHLDADLTVKATDALGNEITWVGQGRDLTVPF